MHQPKNSAVLEIQNALRTIIVISKILPEVQHIHDFAVRKVSIGRSCDGDRFGTYPRSYSVART